MKFERGDARGFGGAFVPIEVTLLFSGLNSQHPKLWEKKQRPYSDRCPWNARRLELRRENVRTRRMISTGRFWIGIPKGGIWLGRCDKAKCSDLDID